MIDRELDPNGVSLAWQPEPALEPVPPPPPAFGSGIPVSRPPTGAVERAAGVPKGVTIAVLGEGPDGLHRETSTRYPLDHEEALDIVGLDPRCPTILVAEDGGVRLQDVGASDGVFLRVTAAVGLRHGDRFVLGGTTMRYEGAAAGSVTGAWGSVVRLREDGWPVERFDVSGLGATIGRSRGDIVLTHDPFVAQAHCRIVRDATGVYLDDLRSANGTFRAASNGDLFPAGSILRLGAVALRVDPAL
ncbi:MAG: FHA domain-containing protein [Myxococcota bacterium]